jgi:type IV pilus assembly protein PilC
MAKFSYQGFSETGANVSGTIDAESIDTAEMLLGARGIIPSSIMPFTKSGLTAISERIQETFGSVSLSDLILFTKQFRSMMHAGIPIIRLLQVLENQTENKVLKKATVAISGDIKEGATLHDAMKKHPAIFSPLYLSMINAGEVSGTVPEILERLIDIIEHEAKIKADIRSALQYPIIVVIALAAAFFILLTFVIPKFVAVFAKAGVTLPLPTKIAMIMYQGLANYWYIILAVVVGVTVALYFYIRTDQGRYVRDAFFLKLPLFGPLFQKAAMSRFASIFAILQTSGVPIMRIMEVLSETLGNTAISREFDRLRDRIQEGQGISGPLSTAKYFTPMVVDMVAIGEESGNIEDMMQAVAVHYDDEVKYAVRRLSDSLGPALVVGLAAVVGFFALAIFLPMWDLTKTIK